MQFTTIASGFTTSARFRLDRPERLLAVHAASAAPSAVFLSFSTSSAGTLSRLYRPEGDGAVFTVVSGSDGWAVLRPPVPWVRVEQANATTDTRTFALAFLNA